MKNEMNIYLALALAVISVLCLFLLKGEYRYQFGRDSFVLDRKEGILYIYDDSNRKERIVEVNYPAHTIKSFSK